MEQLASKGPVEEKAEVEKESNDPAKGDPVAPPVEVEPVVEDCTPFDKYPSFPWYEHIESLIKANNLKGVCGLANVAPTEVATSLESMTHVGPTGYDLIPGGEVLKVFPKEQTHRLAPSMSFIFYQGKLYEIHWITRSFSQSNSRKPFLKKSSKTLLRSSKFPTRSI